MAADHAIFSFIVDDDPAFVYEGWHLAHSLIEHCGGPSAIVVQCTPEVAQDRRAIFRDLGCRVLEIARFGDDRHCNKLNQLDNLRGFDYDVAVLLDTDMIVVSDLRPFLSKTAITGKVVDAPNPPLATLGKIAAATNLPRLPAIVPTDALGGETYLANCNGGFYSVPRACAEKLSIAWRYWALWLLDHIEPLSRVGKQQHADQVSFWLAVHHMGLPFEPAPSNVNYYVHIEGGHHYFDPTRSVALIHYHTALLDVLGRISAKPDSIPAGVDAVTRANTQISKGFNNEVFWNMRYRRFPERGSGVGSRGENLTYKRELLKQQGIEAASSVLDIGCGDLEVVKALSIKRYIGIDYSQESLRLARQARPDWEFHHGATAEIPAAQFVLCFEVLIHQETEASYHKLIAFLADKTLGSLLVSGFSEDTDAIRHNGMVFFHEPLESSLRRTGRFRNIQLIGKHTSVDIYRCDV